jgi:small subunit ribosomal protein S16
MPIRLRLALRGTRHNRIFHLVAIDRRQRRDAKPTEMLGIYNPHMRPGQQLKTIEWSVARIRYWLGVGAIPSKPVIKLLEMASLLSSFSYSLLIVTPIQGNILTPNSQYHPKVSAGPRSPPTTNPSVRTPQPCNTSEVANGHDQTPPNLST